MGFSYFKSNFYFLIVLTFVMSVYTWDVYDNDECEQNNGGCSQTCQDFPIGYECKCQNGYVLINNRTCEDINECVIPGSCSQICYNTEGSHKCECLDGYMLESNNSKRCRAKEGRTIILFINREGIQKIDIESSECTSVVSNLHDMYSFDYDYRTGTLVWPDVDKEAIESAPIDSGVPITTIVPNDLRTLGVAIDWIYGHIYFANFGRSRLEMIDKTWKMRKTIASGDIKKPKAIALDPLEGWIYWTDLGEPAKIERAGMDGSHRTAIVSSSVEWPSNLAIDFVSRKIYWADARLHTLSSVDYNGDNRRIIQSSRVVHSLSSIDVFEDWIYWSDQKGIRRMNKFTGAEITDVTRTCSTSSKSRHIRIYHAYKQPDGKNYCSDLDVKCTHLCLPTPHISDNAPRYTCACPNGIELASDNTSCIVNEPSKAYGNGSKMQHGTFSGTGRLAGTIIGALTGLILLLAL